MQGTSDKGENPLLRVESDCVYFLYLETAVLPGESEDYVADSEDEATKNFKGRVCVLKMCENRVSVASKKKKDPKKCVRGREDRLDASKCFTYSEKISQDNNKACSWFYNVQIRCHI